MNSNGPNLDNQSISYRDAGVDIEAGDALVEQIKPFAKRTMRPEVLGGIGGFGSLFEMPKKFKNRPRTNKFVKMINLIFSHFIAFILKIFFRKQNFENFQF